MLAELDGMELSVGERLKEFYPRRGIDRYDVEGYQSDEQENNANGDDDGEIKFMVKRMESVRIQLKFFLIKKRKKGG